MRFVIIKRSGRKIEGIEMTQEEALKSLQEKLNEPPPHMKVSLPTPKVPMKTQVQEFERARVIGRVKTDPIELKLAYEVKEFQLAMKRIEKQMNSPKKRDGLFFKPFSKLGGVK